MSSPPSSESKPKPKKAKPNSEKTKNRPTKFAANALNGVSPRKHIEYLLKDRTAQKVAEAMVPSAAAGVMQQYDIDRDATAVDIVINFIVRTKFTEFPMQVNTARPENVKPVSKVSAYRAIVLDALVSAALALMGNEMDHTILFSGYRPSSGATPRIFHTVVEGYKYLTFAVFRSSCERDLKSIKDMTTEQIAAGVRAYGRQAEMIGLTLGRANAFFARARPILTDKLNRIETWLNTLQRGVALAPERVIWGDKALIKHFPTNKYLAAIGVLVGGGDNAAPAQEADDQQRSGGGGGGTPAAAAAATGGAAAAAAGPMAQPQPAVLNYIRANVATHSRATSHRQGALPRSVPPLPPAVFDGRRMPRTPPPFEDYDQQGGGGGGSERPASPMNLPFDDLVSDVLEVTVGAGGQESTPLDNATLNAELMRVLMKRP